MNTITSSTRDYDAMELDHLQSFWGLDWTESEQSKTLLRTISHLKRRYYDRSKYSGERLASVHLPIFITILRLGLQL